VDNLGGLGLTKRRPELDVTVEAMQKKGVLIDQMIHSVSYSTDNLTLHTIFAIF
jgi:hypothetical protein